MPEIPSFNYYSLKANNTRFFDKSIVKPPDVFGKYIVAHEHDDNPFFIADLNKLDGLNQEWRRELPDITPFYAVKCNTDRQLLKKLIKLGTGFDCASEAELQMMLSMNVNPNKLLFANTCKSISSLKFAKKHKVKVMTFDSVEELVKIQTYYPQAKLLLRIQTNDKSSIYPMSEKFGASLEEVNELLERALKLRLDIIGVSFHVGSGCTNPEVFNQSIKDSRYIFDQAFKLGINMKILDIGGGFSCDGLAINKAISFSNIAQVIRSSLNEFFAALPQVKVIAEPGRYFAAPIFTLITKVISRKRRNSEIAYFINDGLFGSFAVTKINKSNPKWQLLRKTEQGLIDLDCNSENKVSTLFGPTCAPIDILVQNISMPILQQGDWIIFPDMGAYTSSLATSFNGFLPAHVYYL